MQVERRSWSLLQDISGGRASNTWATCPADRDNSGKPVLIPNSLRPLMRPHGKTVSAVTAGWARGALASWWGNGLPRQRCVADLRGGSEERRVGKERGARGGRWEGKRNETVSD